MRVDRVFAEGEAVTALRSLGFECRESTDRAGQYIIAHPTNPAIGGERTMTIDQLCLFAEGATIAATHHLVATNTVTR
jgi:hypothetical protein